MMQKTTSLIHKTVLKKDITRYAPVWAGYTVVLLLGLFGMWRTPVYMAQDILQSMQSMGIINLIYGGICAAFLFMDLYSGRLCNALHAFPIRRETWLSTHILSGFLFSFVPNLLMTSLSCAILWEYSYVAFIWLAVSTLQFLFFYGSAVLCALCAGNLIGMGTLYGIFHFITVLVLFAVDILYVPLLHGVRLDEDAVLRYFPTNQFTDFDYVWYEVIDRAKDPTGIFKGFNGKDWLYLGLCAVAGILCLLLAVYVYRKRNLESAGDLLSAKKLSPIYVVICTLGTGAALYFISDGMGADGYVFFFLGVVIGFFAARMLLNRTLKVFGKKAFAWLGIFVLALGASFLLTWLDPAGISRYVPESKKIESAAIIGADKNAYYPEYYNGLSNANPGFLITDPDEIAKVQDFHRELVEYRPGNNEQVMCNIRVYYKLTDGRTVNRYYKVAQGSKLIEPAKAYANDIRYIFEVNDPQVLYSAFESVAVSGEGGDKYHNYNFKLTDPEEIRGLMDAIAKDCEAGTMAQNWAYHDKSEENYYLNFSIIEDVQKQLGWRYSRSDLQVFEDSSHTSAYLEQIVLNHPEAETK